MTSQAALPPGWQCFTWPTTWRPGSAMELSRVGDHDLPDQFCLAIRTPDMDAPGAAVIFTYAVQGDAVVCQGISSVGVDITAHIAQVVSALTPAAWQELAQEQVAAFVPAATTASIAEVNSGAAVGRRHQLSRAHLEKVAAVYSDARDAGDAPTRAVQHLFGVSHSTAAKWVGHARKNGLLNPTVKGAVS